MSNATTRTAIAAALSTVAGVTGYPRRPTAFKPGDGWPQWAGSQADQGRFYLEAWNVLIVLPAQEQDADAFADSHQQLLADALRPVMFVDSFAPANIASDGGDVYALLITGRSE
jgi:hypothetical protein